MAISTEAYVFRPLERQGERGKYEQSRRDSKDNQ